MKQYSTHLKQQTKNQIINLTTTTKTVAADQLRKKMKRIKVVIDEMEDGTFSIVNEAGQAIELDFETYDEAFEWAEDNSFNIVNNFHIL